LTGGVLARSDARHFQAEFGFAIQRGSVPGYSVVHKFGRNVAVGTTFVPIAFGGIYQTPQVAGATTLRVAAGNAADTSDGAGAREVTVQGLDANGEAVTEAIVTAGASASAVTSNSYIRLYRFFVSKSGTYATQSAGSHTGDIVIENGTGGTTWGTIDATDFPKGQSEIAVYSIPSGKTGYIHSVAGFSDTSRITNIILFQRTNILQTAAPYDAMRLILTERLNGGDFALQPLAPWGPFVGPTDIGWMGKVEASTSEIDIDFEIRLHDT